ncbi:MAG: gas vesicle protein GvpG [Candidatus Rokubacteria bacterium]|nr:gas vesicle protein GvpG [Candidatus Rokubacteria bacterium]
MLILDTLLVGGFKFILSRIAEAVDTELNDESRWKEELLAAQMRLELGEIDDEQFAGIEHTILERLREIRERQGSTGPVTVGDDTKVTGVEATLWAEGMGGPSRPPTPPERSHAPRAVRGRTGGTRGAARLPDSFTGSDSESVTEPSGRDGSGFIPGPSKVGGVGGHRARGRSR